MYTLKHLLYCPHSNDYWLEQKERRKRNCLEKWRDTMWILSVKKMIFTFCFLLICNQSYAANSIQLPSIVNGHYYAFLIFDNKIDHPVVFSNFYTTPDIDGANEAISMQFSLSKNTYITISDPAYDAFEFELKSARTGKKARFKVTMKENRYYFILVSEKKSGVPAATLLSQQQGMSMLKGRRMADKAQ